MPIAPITTDGPVITVSTLAELKAAYKTLSFQDGGGKILVEPGSYGEMVLYTYGVADGTEPVIIASADPENPAEFNEINLRNCENIRIESVYVDSTGVDRESWKADLNVQDADTIQIVDSTFIHDEGDALKATGEAVEMLGGFRQSANILFEGNYVDGYFLGLDLLDVQNFEVINNEITNIQSDGIRGGGMQDGLIAGNYIHDIYPISQDITHSDLIQIWGVNVDLLTQNVTISDNVLMNSDAATQGIFIRSGELGKDSSVTSGYFQNITISNNLIYSSHIHGITVDDVDGLVVDGNTVLYNPEATMFHTPGQEISYQPIIYTRESLNVTVTNNIAANIKGETLSLSPDDGNQIVTYDNPAETSYASHHFVNPFAGADVKPEDLQMLPSSPWYGLVGTSIGNTLGDFSDGVTAVITANGSDDIYEITYDATSSFDASGGALSDASYSFHWTFGDGTTATGQSATKLYDAGGFKGVDLEIRLNGETVADITRNFAIQTKDIFAFDFEGGVVDTSAAVSEVIDNGTTVAHDGDTSFLIGDGNKLELGRESEGLFAINSFGLALDIELTGDEKSGVFLHLYQTMEGRIENDGSIEFKLSTDQGSYTLTSREPVFDDGEAHRIGIAFDGTTGQLELFADGESVSSTEAWGMTSEAKYWNLVFGNTWGDSVDMLIDNVVMNRDPSVAGDLAEAVPPMTEEEAAPEEPPVEEEPAAPEEPPVEEEPNDPGNRGVPEVPVANDGNSNFLSDLFDIILSLFGLGGGDEPSVTQVAEASYDTSLNQLVPIIKVLDEEQPEDQDDDDDDMHDIAA